MKRCLSMILVFALLLTIAVPAQAVETINVTLSADKETVAPGETVTLTLSIDQTVSNMFCFEYWIYYNADVLELTGTTAGEATSFTDFGDPKSDKNGTYFNVFALNKEGDPWILNAGTIATITFTAKADASGDAAFNLVQEVGLADYDTYEETPANLVNNAANVTVKAAEPEVPADPNTVTLEGEISSIAFSGVTVKENKVTDNGSNVTIDVTLDAATAKDANVGIDITTLNWLVFGQVEEGTYETLGWWGMAPAGVQNEEATLNRGWGGFAFMTTNETTGDEMVYYINFVVDGIDLNCSHTWVKNTCTAHGYCSECGKPGDAAHGHYYVDLACIYCGEYDLPFTFSVGEIVGASAGEECEEEDVITKDFKISVPVGTETLTITHNNSNGLNRMRAYAGMNDYHSNELTRNVSALTIDLTKYNQVCVYTSYYDANWEYAEEGYHLTIEFAEPEPEAPAVTGYTVTMPEDVQTVAGQTVQVPVTVGHTDDAVTAYNAFDFTFTYDPAVLELTSTDIEGMEVVADNGTIRVARYGSALPVGGTALTLTFKALTASTTDVQLTAAKVGVSETALTQEAADASILDDTTAIKITGYTVNLPEGFTGGTTAYPDEDYTFTANDKNYDYTVKATIDGEEINVTDNGDGTFTIDAEDITGNIVITSTKVGKTFNVSLGEDMTSEAANAQYMTPYTATLTKEDGYGYKITVTIGGQPYTGFTYDDATGTLTIPGKDITGDIVINSGKEAGEFTVTFEGNGAGDAQGKAVANGGEEYSFTLTKAEGYEYTVTATMGGKEVELDVVGDTYSIAKVTGDIVITIEKTSDLAVAVDEYVTLNGKTMFLVTATQTLPEGKALSYDGNVMYYSNQYNAWAYLVIVEEGTLTVEDAKDKITDGAASFTTLDQTYDVNEAGKVDINDAQLVFDMYNNEYQDFTKATMQKFLKADVNNSKNIDVNDAAAIVAEIVKAK